MLSASVPVYRAIDKTSTITRRVSESELLLDIINSSGTTLQKGTPAYDAFKLKRSCFCWNAIYDGKPSYQTFVKSTGYLFADIDSIEDVDNIRDALWNSNDHIVTIYRTLSRKGLHVIFKLHDDVVNYIERDPENNYPPVYKYVSHVFFKKKLDPNASKITQLAVISADPELKHRTGATPLNVPEYVLETYKPEEDEQPSQDIDSFIRLSKQEKAAIIFCHYPDIKKRYTHTDFGDPRELQLFLADEYKENRTFITRVSQSYWKDNFHSHNSPRYVAEGIKTFNVRELRGVQKGERARKLRWTLSALLYNNPFTTFQNLLNYALHIVNKEWFTEPLSKDEVMNNVEFIYRRFISGKLTVGKGSTKYIFWSLWCAIPAKDKQRIAKQELDANRRQQCITRIADALQSLISEGINLSISTVSKRSKVSVRTLYRYLELGFIADFRSKTESPSTQKGVVKDCHHYPTYIKVNKYVVMAQGVVKGVVKERKGSTETKQAISDAIDTLRTGTGKITQKRVSELTGFPIRRIKTYWKTFKALVEEHDNPH